MIYIKFKGYKKPQQECLGVFFVGFTYACNVVESGSSYQVTDETGKTIKFNSIYNDSYYKFSVVDLKEEEFTLYTDAHDGKMKYRMNGVDVTKSFFEEKLIEVEHLKSRGVSVFIDFEVGFE